MHTFFPFLFYCKYSRYVLKYFQIAFFQKSYSKESIMNLCDLKTVNNIMKAYGLRPQKELGQNFLTDPAVVSDIAELCCDSNTRTVLEIGPGMGVLTGELAARYEKIIALEIDERLLPVLQYTLGEFDNVSVINSDVMKTDLSALLASEFENGGVSVCANLPYYITSPILMRLIESNLPFDYITVMVQKEVAERLCAKPGGKNCGAITLAVAYRGEAELLFTVPADRFLPAPKVDSAVVRIKLYREKPYHPKSEDMLFSTIRAAFAQRRKTLVNALCAGFPSLQKDDAVMILEKLGMRSDIRGERLGIEEFIMLSDAILSLGTQPT